MALKPRDARSSEPLVLRLYFVNGAPSSERAAANVRALREEVEAETSRLWEVEYIDVASEPSRALADRVLVTPMLVRVAPAPEVRVAGDLSDRDTVRHVLGLAEPE